MTEIKSLLERAASLAREKGPADAWPAMWAWAEKEQHPFAMKAAVFQFLEIHGTKPEAASIVPQVLHTASSMHLESSERERLVGLSNRVFRSLELNLRKEHLVPISNERPAPAFFLNPYEARKADIYAPAVPSRDVMHMISARDTIFNVNQAIRKVKNDGK